MMKYVPNALSFARIVLAISLFFIVIFHPAEFPVETAVFMTAYLVAGFTDMIDGPIARKFKVATKFGANMDGIADYIFVAAALITIVPALPFFFLRTIILLGIFAGLKVLGMLVGYLRFGQLMMMHTYASKTGALLAFAFPVVVIAIIGREHVNIAFLVLVLYVYAFLIEEMAINIIMPYPKRDITGVLEAIRIRREGKPAQ